MAERNVDLIIRAKNDASKAFEDVNGALTRLADVQEKVANGASLMKRALSGAEGDVKALGTAFDEGAALKAKDGLEQVGLVLERLGGKLAEQRAEIAQTITKYADLGTQLAEAKKSLDRIKNAEGVDAEKQAAQIKTVEGAIKRLQREYDKTGATLTEQNARLEQTVGVYNRVEAAAGATAGSIRRLNTVQKNYAQGGAVEAQERLAAAFRSAGREAKITTADQTRLAAAFREGESNARAWIGVAGRVAAELRKIGQAGNQASTGLERANGATRGFRGALNSFYGDSRKALSLMQRLRGEVLSLTATFVGFYGIFNTGRSITASFSQLEAATNRLNAAFDGNASVVEAELASLRAEADRLGISFDILSDQYSKFQISGQAAGLQSDELKVIFTQVAEAGRVLKLSNEQIAGTFNALTQIAGKGTLQMEELRQQLGDRIPGAVGIVAQALGYGTDELDKFYKAVEDGQVGAREALIAFGQGVEEQFGDQLEEALDSVQTKIGRLQNLLFERQLTAANSGFIAGLETAIAALNEFLASDEGIEFFEKLGAAFGNLFELLPGVIDNLDLIFVALQALVALKVAQFVRGIATNFGGAGRTLVSFRQQVIALNASAYAISPAFASAVFGVGRFGAALRAVRGIIAATSVAVRGLLAAFGGPLGIAVAAISFFATDAIAGAITATDEFNDILSTHEEVMAGVSQAHTEAAGDVDKFRESLEKVSSLKIEDNLRDMREALQGFQRKDARGANRLDRGQVLITGAQRDFVNELLGADQIDVAKNLIEVERRFAAGRASGEEYRDALRGARDALDDVSDSSLTYLVREEEVADKAIKLEEAIAESQRVLDARNGSMEAASEIMAEMGDATEGTTQKTEDLNKKWQEFQESMEALKKAVPGLNDELKRLDALAEIETNLTNALAAARDLPEEILRIAAAQDALNAAQLAKDAVLVGGLPDGFDTAEDGVQATAALLRSKEGFRPRPYNDPRTDRNGNQIGPDIYRAGYGSDTITLADGSIRKIVQGMTVTRQDAERDLIRRIAEEFLPRAREQVGAERFDSFTPQQQAVLGSIAYNYGELPARIVDELRSGNTNEIAQAIRDLGGDNGGVNRNRRNEEAAIFSQSVGEEAAQTRAAEAIQDEIEDRETLAEKQAEFNASLDDQIDKQEFLNSLEGQRLIDAKVAEAIYEAEEEARKVGLKLTQEQRKEIERTTRAQYASQQAEEDRNAALEQAKRLQEDVALLQEKRALLEDRIANLQAEGDSEGVATAKEELESVNAQLDDAITKALEFWAAIGGEGSEAAVVALQRTREGLKNAGDQAVLSGEEINNMISRNLGGAISKLSEEVANGEASWQSFAAAALKALGETLVAIGQAIVQAAILNALTGSTTGGSGGVGGAIASAIGSIFHGGGIAGGASQTRTVNPAVFANAVRYHTGGIAGFAPDEVGAVLKRGEEILTENDPRHRFNGGAGGDGTDGLTIINSFDAEEVMERALSTPRGKKALVNAVRGQNTEIKAALG